jgi:hypothetical protein
VMLAAGPAFGIAAIRRLRRTVVTSGRALPGRPSLGR